MKKLSRWIPLPPVPGIVIKMGTSEEEIARLLAEARENHESRNNAEIRNRVACGELKGGK